jgi:DNA-binding transcriptional ArsR family regulator
MGGREATADEARALANPLRLRILRLCLDEARTNKEIADRLGRDPGSTLHHVRMLVDAGFLAAGDVRQGARGALEKPYRATGKSWQVRVEDPAAAAGTHLAMVDAFRAEVAEAGPAAVVLLSRFANTLNEASKDELVARLEAVIDEFALRRDPDGTPFAFLLGGHRRAVATEPGGSAARGR